MVNQGHYKDKFITVNGVRLHYLDWGNEKMPVIIFLPGLSATGHDFDPIASCLQDKFHCIALDQRGQGDSQWADSYEEEEFTRDIAGFVYALKFGRISLVGHSLGGRTGMFFAGTYPGKMDRLVIVDMAAEVDSGQTTKYSDSTPPGTRSSFSSIDDFIAFQRQRMPKAKEEPLRTYVTCSTRELPDGTRVYKHDPKLERIAHFLQKDVPSVVVIVPWQIVAQIKCPTLIIRGSDSFVLSRGVAQKMKATIARAELAEIEGASHGIHVDKPDELKEVVERFFRENR